MTATIKNQVYIHYCYPTSVMSRKLDAADRGGFYVVVGKYLTVSPLFRTIHAAEGFCRNHCLEWEPHQFPMD